MGSGWYNKVLIHHTINTENIGWSLQLSKEEIAKKFAEKDQRTFAWFYYFQHILEFYS